MLKIKLVVVALLLTLSTTYAQLSLNTPYSRFGLGNISNTSNAFYQSMGGLSNSYASSRFINTENPALLSSTKFTTFDLGVSYSGIRASSNGFINTSQTVNFDYLRLAFPLKNRYVIGLGLAPYSQVNYNNTIITQLDDVTKAVDTYKGEGGISKMSLTQSYSVIKDSLKGQTLSLGADFSFLAGNIQKSSQIQLKTNNVNDFSQTSLVNSAVYRGYQFNFGTSYRKEFFVGNTFETIKDAKCSDKNGSIAIVPKFDFKEQITVNAANSIKTKYAIIYINSTEIKLDEKIKDKDHRELIYGYYSSFLKKGYGVMVFENAEGVSFGELKSDYIEAVKILKENPNAVNGSYDDAEKFSRQYLKYGSGVFINAGASFELNSDLNTSGSESITRIRTSTGDPFQTYQLSEFDNYISTLPSVLKLGISLDKPLVKGNTICGELKKSVWVVGADLSLFNWSQASNLNQSLGYSNTFKVTLGGSFTPNPKNENLKFNTGIRRLLNTTSYQGGLYYQSLPYTYNNSAVNELGINFGFTIPTNHEGSLLTMNFGLAKRGSDLQQNYFKAGLGFTINESNWFKPVRVGR